MPSLYSSFSIFDKVIRHFRFRQVAKYLPENAVVCDIGCGSPPKLLLGLQDKIKLGVGFDKEIAETKWGSKIETRNLDLENMDISKYDGNFDCVLMLAVLEHLEKPHSTLKETKKIIKDKGRIILTTPSPRAKPVLDFLAFRLGIISKQAISDHKHYFSKKEIIDTLQELGFSDIKHRFFEMGLNQLIIAQK